MAGYNFAQNIIGLNKTNGDIHELEVKVANLSASTLPYSTDETIKEAIDDKASKEWTLIGTKKFNVSQFLNARYTEYFIEANIENDMSVVIPMALTRQQLTVNAKTFRTGYYFNATNYGTIAITTAVSGDDIYIKLTYFDIGGTSYSNSEMTVYGR